MRGAGDDGGTGEVGDAVLLRVEELHSMLLRNEEEVILFVSRRAMTVRTEFDAL